MASGLLTQESKQLALQSGANLVVEKTFDSAGRSWIPTNAILAHVERNEMAPQLDPDELVKLARVTRDHVIDVVIECDGNITRAARRLGMARSSLQQRLRAISRTSRRQVVR
jgi:DNA-binding NtrC family response regulator